MVTYLIWPLRIGVGVGISWDRMRQNFRIRCNFNSWQTPPTFKKRILSYNYLKLQSWFYNLFFQKHTYKLRPTAFCNFVFESRRDIFMWLHHCDHYWPLLIPHMNYDSTTVDPCSIQIEKETFFSFTFILSVLLHS